MPNPILRTVIESHNFWAQRNNIEPDVKRMDEILEGVTWVLCRNPRIGQQVYKDVWAITTTEYPNALLLTIYYTFNQDEVLLLSIRKFQ